MSRKPVNDIGASVRERLKRKADDLGYDFQFILTTYALDRLLYRLACSKYNDRFILKGAQLFNAWYHQPVRSSMDADILGKGDNDIASWVGIFRDICQVIVEPDGLIFLPDTVLGLEIRENLEYQGVRITLIAGLSDARIPLQIDIGFGDTVFPPPKKILLPSFLDLPVTSIKAYTPYTVIAEKFQTIVDKGLFNSRMKDYYDIWYISRHSDIEGIILSKSINATFKRRKTTIPESVPEGLGDAFVSDNAKQRQWAGFLKKSKPDEGCELSVAVKEVRIFLMPVIESLKRRKPYNKKWNSGRGWV